MDNCRKEMRGARVQREKRKSDEKVRLESKSEGLEYLDRMKGLCTEEA